MFLTGEPIKSKIKRNINKFNRLYTYALHEKIVSLFYGKVDDTKIFHINKDVCEKLSSIIKSMKRIKFSNYNNQKEFKNFQILEKKMWSYNKKDVFVYEQFNKIQEWFDIEDNKYIREFTVSLFPSIKEYLKSYFSIVNIRVWNNVPNGKVAVGRNNIHRGTYRDHTDSFPPGHTKIMIYLNPLDDDHGYFTYENKVLKSKKTGLAIAFKNSDVVHRAIPGKLKNRTVIELTMFRTLKKVNEMKYFYPSTPDTSYLVDPLQAYL